MKKVKFNICIFIFCSATTICFSQGKSNAQCRIFSNKVTESKTYITLFDKSGNDSLHYLESIITYNAKGFRVTEYYFQKDSSVFERFEYNYKYDTLGVKIKSYNGANVPVKVSNYKYNPEGQRTSWKIKYLQHPEVIIIHYQYDASGHLSTTSNIKNGRLVMTTKSFYDADGNEIRKEHYNPKKKLVATYLFEYDAHHQLMKTYHNTTDELIEENKYNVFHELVENKIYYTSTTTISGLPTGTEKYAAGDVKSYLYSYDDNGLVNKRSMYINDKIRTTSIYLYKTNP